MPGAGERRRQTGTLAHNRGIRLDPFHDFVGIVDRTLRGIDCLEVLSEDVRGHLDLDLRPALLIRVDDLRRIERHTGVLLPDVFDRRPERLIVVHAVVQVIDKRFLEQRLGQASLLCIVQLLLHDLRPLIGNLRQLLSGLPVQHLDVRFRRLEVLPVLFIERIGEERRLRLPCGVYRLISGHFLDQFLRRLPVTGLRLPDRVPFRVNLFFQRIGNGRECGQFRLRLLVPGLLEVRVHVEVDRPRLLLRERLEFPEMFGEARITLKRRRRAQCADVLRVKVLLEVGLRVLLIQRLELRLVQIHLDLQLFHVGAEIAGLLHVVEDFAEVFRIRGERIRRRRHPLFRRAFADGLNEPIHRLVPAHELIIIGHRNLDVQPLLEHRCLGPEQLNLLGAIRGHSRMLHDLVDLIAAFNGRGLAHLLRVELLGLPLKLGLFFVMLFLERVPLRLETIGFLCQCEPVDPHCEVCDLSEVQHPGHTVSLESATGPTHAIRQHPGMVFLVLIPLILRAEREPASQRFLLNGEGLFFGIVGTLAAAEFREQRFDHLVVHVLHPAAGHGIQRPADATRHGVVALGQCRPARQTALQFDIRDRRPGRRVQPRNLRAGHPALF